MLLFVVLFFNGLELKPYAQDQNQASIEEIKRAYASRQAALKCVRIVYSVKEKIKKGAFNIMFGGNGLHGLGGNGPVDPPENLELITEADFIVNGDSMRLDENGEIWNTGTKTKDKTNATQVFDDGKYKRLDRLNKSGVTSLDNEIIPSAELRVLASFIALEYSALSNHPWAVIGSSPAIVTIGNTDYNKPRWGGATRYELSLDPKRGYIPTRLKTMYPNGTLSMDCLLGYAVHAELGYLPTSATLHIFTDDVKVISKEIRIKEFKGNTKIDPKTFYLKFPVGTRVFDRSSKAFKTIGDGIE